MAKPVTITQDIKTEGNEEQKIKVELTQEELDALKDIQAAKAEIEKKEKEVAARAKELSDRELAMDSKKTAKELKETQKMVTVIVPISERNPDDKVVPVTINGYTWQIKRGEEVEVPEEVKRILKEAKYI